MHENKQWPRFIEDYEVTDWLPTPGKRFTKGRKQLKTMYTLQIGHPFHDYLVGYPKQFASKV